MKKTNFVCGRTTGTVDNALGSLQEQIAKMLRNYDYRDAVISPAQVVVTNTPCGDQITAYTTVYLPSADNTI
jgi:hypothetical protein